MLTDKIKVGVSEEVFEKFLERANWDVLLQVNHVKTRYVSRSFPQDP